MKISLKKLKNYEVDIVNELTKDFNINIDNNGLVVEFINSDNYRIIKENNEFKIYVNKKIQISHSLGYLSSIDLNNFTLKDFEVNFDGLSYMADCSRNAVIKVDVLKKLIRHLAFLGYTAMGLYIEDTFEMENEEYFGYLRNRYTKEDLKEINNYGNLLGVEVIPYIQTLAHLNGMMRWGEYFDIVDCHDILLVGNDKTYKLIDKIFATMSECFSTKRINIGMDEAHFLGRGNYLAQNGYKDRYDVMKQHLELLTPIIEKYNFKPMMWSDMYFRFVCGGEYYGTDGKLDAKISKDIPENMQLVYWDYYHLDNTYDQMLKKHKHFNREIIFAGGAWKWIGFTPDNRYSIEASKKALKACIKHGIKDVVITGWGDNGAECSVFAILPSLFYNSTVMYNVSKEYYNQYFKSFTDVEYNDFMTLDLANRISKKPLVSEKNSSNKYLLYNDILLGIKDSTVEEGFNDLYKSHASKLNRVIKKDTKWNYLFETQYGLTKALSIKSELGIKLRNAYKNNDLIKLELLKRDCKKLIQLLDKFNDSMLEQWTFENRANGFDVIDLRMGALKQRINYAIKKIDKYLNKEIESIEELEEIILDFHGKKHEHQKPKDICEYRWLTVSSVNVNN